jgi:hypothetical protein
MGFFCQESKALDQSVENVKVFHISVADIWWLSCHFRLDESAFLLREM